MFEICKHIIYYLLILLSAYLLLFPYNVPSSINTQLKEICYLICTVIRGLTLKEQPCFSFELCKTELFSKEN